MICYSEKCLQKYPGGNCKMICTSSVQECNQVCATGGCTVQCDAEKCSLHYPWGAWKQMKSTTSNTTSTTAPSPICTNTGLQPSVVLRLVFSIVLYL